MYFLITTLKLFHHMNWFDFLMWSWDMFSYQKTNFRRKYSRKSCPSYNWMYIAQYSLIYLYYILFDHHFLILECLNVSNIGVTWVLFWFRYNFSLLSSLSSKHTIRNMSSKSWSNAFHSSLYFKRMLNIAKICEHSENVMKIISFIAQTIFFLK